LDLEIRVGSPFGFAFRNSVIRTLINGFPQQMLSGEIASTRGSERLIALPRLMSELFFTQLLPNGSSREHDKENL
jgi:hypothetical protein